MHKIGPNQASLVCKCVCVFILYSPFAISGGSQSLLGVSSSYSLVTSRTGRDIEPDSEVQRIRLPGPAAPKVVWSGALSGVVLAHQAKATDRPGGGGRLPNARLWHLPVHRHFAGGALCLQVSTAELAKKAQGMLLEESQFDVLLTGQCA